MRVALAVALGKGAAVQMATGMTRMSAPLAWLSSLLLRACLIIRDLARPDFEDSAARHPHGPAAALGIKLGELKHCTGCIADSVSQQ